MKTTVVTTGKRYTDIDGYACAIAYAELLNLRGESAEAVLPGALNHSITKTVKSWGLDFKTAPTADDFDSVLVDISSLPFCPEFVREDNVKEVYDHHYGHEEYWNTKLGADSHIEPVGACATLIWEEFKKNGMWDKISELSARLLLTAIISNTLNFGAQITDARDIAAYEDLKDRANLSEDWIHEYFNEQEESVFLDPKAAIAGDTKVVSLSNLPFSLVIGQMELWDSCAFLENHKSEIEQVLSGFGHEHWVMSLPSVGEKKNYIYATNPEVQMIFSKIIGARFEGDVGVTEKLWLRKEIRKKLSEL